MENTDQGYFAQHSSEKTINSVYKNLNRWNPNDAFSFMRQDGYINESLLLEVLAREVPKQKRLNCYLTIAVITLLLISLLEVGLGFYLQGGHVWLASAPLLFIVAAVWGVAISSGAVPTRVQKRGALCLCLLCETLENVHSVGPLLEGLGFWFGPMWQGRWLNAAYYALFRLLPRLDTSDSHWLTSRQVGVLERMMLHLWTTRARWTKTQRWENDPNSLDRDFHVAVLSAIGRVGQASALPTLKKLARLKVNSKTQKAVRDAAQEAYDAVKARLQV